ncbi:GNAT family N-acetyltransferase [Epibacterium sp. SM1969]|uniref:GNAT family N-acetyltransferase n=2 Tax=Tritonibacter aquimaris TaxID=2663379 RepID=A0A844AVK1_9RHOB|nr:GNAT family N-acetyltransferase [Tritonibacter aquimaris]MQY42021.1 GNAT family N-acetyltransferase [Tritonibacter aquimaris]
MEIFVHEQGVPLEEEIDDLDGEAIHILARDGDVAVATARILQDGAVVKIGRVCVVKSARGTGLGADLMRYALECVQQLPGVQRVKLGAQTYAIGFYERLGFAAYGPIYDDGGIPHRDMVKELK